MKGIILAGGLGTRLYPSTFAVSKQILPVFDKPMIFYPLSVLMLSKIRDVLIISDKKNIGLFQKLFKDGSALGMNMCYEIQREPNGIAESFIVGEKFIDNKNVSLILGDNIFHGHGFTKMLQNIKELIDTFKYDASFFAYEVSNPQNFGVANFDDENQLMSIDEKPKIPGSNFAVTGLYMYDSDVCEVAKSMTPSQRNELEITDVNNFYIKNKNVHLNLLERGFSWLDSGTHESLLESSNLIRGIQSSQGFKIACLEEISLNNGWINKDDILKFIDIYKNSQYGEYVKSLVK